MSFIAVLFALHLSILPPNAELFDFNSPFATGGGLSAWSESINLETKITFLDFVFVGGGVDTIIHVGDQFGFVPTYEKYTFNAGFDLHNEFGGVIIKYTHECIHPIQVYDQQQNGAWYNNVSDKGRYEGSYNMVEILIHGSVGPFEFGFNEGYFLSRFIDYSIDFTSKGTPLGYCGSYQKLHIKPFYLAFDEKVYWKFSYSNYLFGIFKAETGLEFDHIIFGVRWESDDPVAPILWSESINYNAKNRFSAFVDIKT